MVDAAGLVVEEPDACVCWINMPTFKSNSLFIRAVAHLAALIKIPSRVTTFLEMALSSSRNGSEHVAPLRAFEGESFELHTCDAGESGCSLPFSFTKADKLVRFRGAHHRPRRLRRPQVDLRNGSVVRAGEWTVLSRFFWIL